MNKTFTFQNTSLYMVAAILNCPKNKNAQEKV